MGQSCRNAILVNHNIFSSHCSSGISKVNFQKFYHYSWSVLEIMMFQGHIGCCSQFLNSKLPSTSCSIQVKSIQSYAIHLKSFFSFIQLLEMERWIPFIVHAHVWNWYSFVILLRSSSLLEILFSSTLFPLSMPIYWTFEDSWISNMATWTQR